MTPDTDNADTPDRPDRPVEPGESRKRTRRGGRRSRGGLGLVGAERLAKAVKARREERGWTQQDVVQQGHLSLNRLQAIEAGRTAQYRRTTLEDLDRGLEWIRGSAARVLYENGSSVSLESMDNPPGDLSMLDRIMSIDDRFTQGDETGFIKSLGELVPSVSTTEDYYRRLYLNTLVQLEDLRRRLMDLLRLIEVSTVPKRGINRDELLKEIQRLTAVLPEVRETVKRQRIMEAKIRYGIEIPGDSTDIWTAAMQLREKGYEEAAKELLQLYKL